MKIKGACVVLLLLNTAVRAETPLEESGNADIEYASPQLAIEALRKKQGVEVVTEDNGWIIAADQRANALWSFSPVGDPAYPAMVKRTITQSPQGGMDLKMEVSCGASKEACDNLVRKFVEMNEKAVQ